MIIPIFLMNRGCRRRCLFCNESLVAAADHSHLSEEAFHEIVRAHLASAGERGVQAEIAFYGGTFTGLPKDEQKRLLQMAAPYLMEGSVSGIRISTRPDEIRSEALGLLAEGGVRTVELGAQSLDDEVLRRCRRGHSASDTEQALGLLKERGFETGLHLMLGLPGDTPGRFAKTVEKAITLAPDTVRLHPTLVLRDTPLAQEYLAGRYRPLALAEAVSLCADALRSFTLAGIRVIRLGLQTTRELEAPGAVLAGPFHPALRSLVEERIMFEMASLLLSETSPPAPGRPLLLVAPADLAHLIGPNGRGLRCLKERFLLPAMEVRGDPSLPRRTLVIRWGGKTWQTDWSGRIEQSTPGRATMR